MKDFQPLISIITITFNAEKFLEQTIQSVLSQTYSNVEYIIVDGQSTDATVAIIEKYQKYLATWISERDEGIYDAMNKGLALAKGDYVWFMNAGDEIYEPQTLESILKNKADIYYGETDFYSLEGKYLGIRSEATPMSLPSKLTWKHLKMGLVVCHQAIIVRKDLAPQYDLQHAYSADIDWVIRALKQAETVHNTKEKIAKYIQGGYSRRFLVRSLKDRFLILQRHFGFFPNIFNHILIVLRSLKYIISKRKTY